MGSVRASYINTICSYLLWDQCLYRQNQHIYCTNCSLLGIYYDLKTTWENPSFLHCVPKLPIKISFLLTQRTMKDDFYKARLVVFEVIP